MLNEAKTKRMLNIDNTEIKEILDGKDTANQYILDLSTHAKILSYFTEQIREIYENTDINTATGEGLDRIGAFFNMPRLDGQPAKCDITITSPPTSQTTRIAAGTPILLTGAFIDENYILSENVTIAPNVTETTATIETIDHAIHPPLTIGAVTGIKGHDTISATNTAEGTTGRNIEEDTEYRQRIREWSTTHTKGTIKCVENYLDNYEGVDSYKIIPHFERAGTCKIICDTIESQLNTIKQDIIKDCLLITDEDPYITLPGIHDITYLTLHVHVDNLNLLNTTEDQLKEKIRGQTNTFVRGGYTTDGQRIKGMKIGQNFYPSELLKYLQTQIPEIDNIRCDPTTTVVVEDTNIFTVQNIDVILE